MSKILIGLRVSPCRATARTACKSHAQVRYLTFAPKRTRSPIVTKLRNFTIGSIIVVGTPLLLTYLFDSRAGIHRYAFIPLLHTFTDAETSHTLAIKALKLGLSPKDKGTDDTAVIGCTVWGHPLASPIGLAAGFDKEAEAIDGIFDLGFSYVEVGSITPEAQPGNPKPRYYRLPETKAAINRYGFNSSGHKEAVLHFRDRIRRYIFHHTDLVSGSEEKPDVYRLLSTHPGAVLTDGLGLPRSLRPGKLLGINLGKNKRSDPEALEDYVKGVEVLGPFADVLVLNVSSPNTPGLRGLQRAGMISELLSAVVKARARLDCAPLPRLVLKVAPDLDERGIEAIAQSAVEEGIDGIIVGNTTLERPQEIEVDSPLHLEVGGLSGPPLKPITMKAIRLMRAHLLKASKDTKKEAPLIIGCGGISTAEDVIDYGRAGAQFVQLYTSLGYEGPGLPRRMKDELTTLLRASGRSWSDIVGTEKPVEIGQGKQKASRSRQDQSKGSPKPGDQDLSALFSSAEQIRVALNELGARMTGQSPPIVKTSPQKVKP